MFVYILEDQFFDDEVIGVFSSYSKANDYGKWFFWNSAWNKEHPIWMEAELKEYRKANDPYADHTYRVEKMVLDPERSEVQQDVKRLFDVAMWDIEHGLLYGSIWEEGKMIGLTSQIDKDTWTHEDEKWLRRLVTMLGEARQEKFGQQDLSFCWDTWDEEGNLVEFV